MFETRFYASDIDTHSAGYDNKIYHDLKASILSFWYASVFFAELSGMLTRDFSCVHRELKVAFVMQNDVRAPFLLLSKGLSAAQSMGLENGVQCEEHVS